MSKHMDQLQKRVEENVTAEERAVALVKAVAALLVGKGKGKGKGRFRKLSKELRQAERRFLKAMKPLSFFRLTR